LKGTLKLEEYDHSIDLLIGDAKKIAKFWRAPWLEGLKPKDNAPSFFCHLQAKYLSAHKAFRFMIKHIGSVAEPETEKGGC
jgi:hypothetical protein